MLALVGALLVGGCTSDGTSTTSQAPTGTSDGVSTSAGSGQDPAASVSLRYALDSPEEVLTTTVPGATVSLDAAESADGAGSVKITAERAVTVALVETGDLDIEDATLFYRAKLRTQGLEGRAYLEMWCTFPDLGEYFSRGLDAPVEGTTEWVSVQTPFFLEEGQNPDNVKLNVVVEGTGIVWVDQLELDGVATE